MSLQDLLSVHTVDVYPLSQTKDSMGATVESLGTRTSAGVSCRMTPLSEKEREVMEQRQLVATHRVQFASDPSLTLQTALVRNSRVYHVREVANLDGIGWSWIAMVEYMPQVEIAAP